MANFKKLQEPTCDFGQQVMIGDSMYEYKCTIVKVIDGDTTDVDIDLGFGVWMKKQRIRFYGPWIHQSHGRVIRKRRSTG